MTATTPDAKPILSLTPAAVARVKWLMCQADMEAKAEEKMPPVLGVRVGTQTKGCSGLVYKLDYVTDPRPEDLRVVQDGAVVFIDPSATLYLFGSIMDYVATELEARFTFSNPNAKGSCGCGESFHV